MDNDWVRFAATCRSTAPSSGPGWIPCCGELYLVGGRVIKTALDRLWGAYADREQVHDHRNLCDCARNDDECVNFLGEAGDQERREQVHEVADAPHDQQG